MSASRYAGYQTALVSRCAGGQWTLMLHMNAWQGLLSYATCWSNGDEASRALAFVRAHPDVSLDLGAFLVSKAPGRCGVYKLAASPAPSSSPRSRRSARSSPSSSPSPSSATRSAPSSGRRSRSSSSTGVGEYAAAALVERKKPKAA
ncbi:UDP-galactose transmembrane transporter [Aureococcus anophagefferens]|uniref:UDP-galactose transmembrane transporter n=1 Tax=Aureococcus anophagefferens TaxID=44056 RepID=A0ABR1G700_AURAN